VALSPKQVGVVVDRLYRRLLTRRPDADKAMKYFKGEQGTLRYATKEFAEATGGRYEGFSDNWCAPVVTAGAERTALRGIKLPGGDLARPSADESRLWDAFKANDMQAQLAMAFLQAPIQKRAFVSVWAHRAGPRAGRPLIAVESATQAIVEYDPEVRWHRRFGLKTYCDDVWEYASFSSADSAEDGPGIIVKLRRPIGANTGIRSSGLIVPGLAGQPWEVVGEPSVNHLGLVPLVELPYRPLLNGEPLSDIHGAMAIQDAVNLFWMYLFNAADFASLPARVVMGQGPPKLPMLNEDGQKIGERAVDSKELTNGRMLWLTGQATSIGKWDAAQLDPFTKVIDQLVGHLAAQTRTPPYYLTTNQGLANISSQTVEGLTQGLVEKVSSAEEHYDGRIQDVLELVALQMGDTKLAERAAQAQILWKDRANRSEAQKADAFQKRLASGYPFEWLLIEDGKSPEEIDIIMRLKEKEERAAMLAGVQGSLGVEGLFRAASAPAELPPVSQLPEGEPAEF
jgi:hypothetical protein